MMMGPGKANVLGLGSSDEKIIRPEASIDMEHRTERQGRKG